MTGKIIIVAFYSPRDKVDCEEPASPVGRFARTAGITAPVHGYGTVNYLGILF